MNTTILFTFCLIVLARIIDVTLDTIRTVAIVQGRRVFAAVLGFFEAVIYISAIAKVLLNMNHPVYALAYGIGFASGTFLGITIEQYLAFGDQLATLVTRKGVDVADALRTAGYRFIDVKGHATDSDLTLLYVEVPRRQAQKLIREARTADEWCFCIVNDVRVTQSAARRGVSADQTLSSSHAS
ncbi:MAG: hypothetical protein JWM99_2501 [Verrucomicrobiales bacterium]|nr:hypothetical protein [Verrucomicrobiales bacterium]